MRKPTALTRARYFTRYTRWLMRYSRFILLISGITAVVGSYFSVKLYQNLRTDIEEMLPETALSVRDLKAASKRVGGLNHISIVVESSDRKASQRFVDDVASRLNQLPKTLVSRVQYNINTEKKFFEQSRSLYIDLQDWESLYSFLKNRVTYERRAKSPFSLGLEDPKELQQTKPEFDFEALRVKYKNRSEGFDRFADGYFASRDGKIHVVLAFLAGKVTDIASNAALSQAAHEIVENLNPKVYAPDMVVGFDGDVQNVVEEHHSVIEDLIKSSVIVSLLVGLVLWLFYRSFSSVAALCLSLISGVACTFGLTYFLVGYLNANTAFLGSIVVGNGINFGIIFLARYFEEWRSFKKVKVTKVTKQRAVLTRALTYTAQATSTAALAAGLSYLSLSLTDFRGFNQFGIIGGLGMVLCWISAFTTLPALLIWGENLGWLKVPRVSAKSGLATLFAKVMERVYTPLIIFTLISIVVSAFFISDLAKKGVVETDFSKLRSKQSMISGSGYWDQKVNAVFERYLTPTAILTNTEKDAAIVAQALRDIIGRDGERSVVANVKTIEDIIPSNQAEKIKVISEIQKILTPTLMSKLDSNHKKLVKEFIPKGDVKPVGISDLPVGVKVNFQEQDGSIGRMIHVYPKLGQFWNANEIIQFTTELREAVRNAKVPAIIAGQPPVSADMISAILKDGPKATFFAFLAVALLVIILFPQWRLSGLILASLLIGVIWMGGFMGLLGTKINFLNFIALPITFGIGVDYAVNIVSRYQLSQNRSISEAIANTGGAVALCSATTIIGYSSLLIASNQAFNSFGRLAVLGELTCLAAALLVLPAVWHLKR